MLLLLFLLLGGGLRRPGCEWLVVCVCVCDCVMCALRIYNTTVERVRYIPDVSDRVCARVCECACVCGCARTSRSNPCLQSERKYPHTPHPTPCAQVITRMVFHPTQPLVFTGCLDAVVRCWDLRTGGMVRQYGGHMASIQDLAVSPDGSMILSGSDDNTAKVFMTAGGMP